MAAKTGTVVYSGRAGALGVPFRTKGKIVLDAALASTNTYAIANFFPTGKKKAKGFRMWANKILDTSATPDLVMKIGKGTGTTANDDDGLFTSQTNGFLAGVVHSSPGADIDGAAFTDTDLVITVSTTAETGATDATIWFECDYEMA